MQAAPAASRTLPTASLACQRCSPSPETDVNCEAAKGAAVITEDQRFSLHGLKHRGVTDTAGNINDKQDAAGHVDQKMTQRYSHELAVVEPPKRPEFSRMIQTDLTGQTNSFEFPLPQCQSKRLGIEPTTTERECGRKLPAMQPGTAPQRRSDRCGPPTNSLPWPLDAER